MSRADRIKRCIVENFVPDATPDDLPDDYDLIDNGVITSLGMARLITVLGREFDIDIDAADVRPEYFRTVTSIDEFIERTTADVPAMSG